MHPKIWGKLITNRYETKPFEIFGYSRKALKERVYPGLIIDETESVRGLLYLNVSARDLQIIDDFEGLEYKRINTMAEELKEVTVVQTYLYIGASKALTDKDWDFDNFINEQILTFENSFEGWLGK